MTKVVKFLKNVNFEINVSKKKNESCHINKISSEKFKPGVIVMYTHMYILYCMRLRFAVNLRSDMRKLSTD